jgi:DNA-binding transcriptional ArsR family regulator
MKSTVAEVDLLHLLLPHVRAEILRIVCSDPPRETYGREAARETTFALRTVQRELALLEAAGIVISRKQGRRRLFRANRKHRMFHSLQQLVSKGASRPAFVNKAKRPRQGWRRSDRRQQHPRVTGAPLPKPWAAFV